MLIRVDSKASGKAPTHDALQELLALEMELLMSEDAVVVPGLRPALARLANAMVAVLGPELTTGSAAYTKTKCILQDLQVGCTPKPDCNNC